MNDLRELYQEVILDHGRRPRNFGPLPDATAHADGNNPLCGDRLTVHVKQDGETIERIGFEGAGCAICMASASIMTETLSGRTRQECDRKFEHFHSLVTGCADLAADDDDEKLQVFAGVSEYPMRVKCATLAWHTLRAALGSGEDEVSTE